MSEKSYVTLETHVCPVCGKEHQTGDLLLDRRLQNKFDRETVTGFSICFDCEKQYDGKIIFIEIDRWKSGSPDPKTDRINPNEAFRTGTVFGIRESVARELFSGTELGPINYVDSDVTEYVMSLMEKSQ